MGSSSGDGLPQPLHGTPVPRDGKTLPESEVRAWQRAWSVRRLRHTPKLQGNAWQEQPGSLSTSALQALVSHNSAKLPLCSGLCGDPLTYFWVAQGNSASWPGRGDCGFRCWDRKLRAKALQMGAQGAERCSQPPSHCSLHKHCPS